MTERVRIIAQKSEGRDREVRFVRENGVRDRGE